MHAFITFGLDYVIIELKEFKILSKKPYIETRELG